MTKKKVKDLDGPVKTTKEDITGIYMTDLESKSYQIGLKALSKYNRLAYKEILFTVLPNLRNGKFLGETTDGKNYILSLTCDEAFVKVHGEVYIHYSVDGRKVTITTIEPAQILEKLHRKLVSVHDGIPITDNKDLFKLNLYKCMKGAK